jgi:hypothetical protein
MNKVKKSDEKRHIASDTKEMQRITIGYENSTPTI